MCIVKNNFCIIAAVENNNWRITEELLLDNLLLYALLVCSDLIVVWSFSLSWFTLEQRVDLKAEGLWDELLDTFQPDIAVEDWYIIYTLQH